MKTIQYLADIPERELGHPENPGCTNRFSRLPRITAFQGCGLSRAAAAELEC
jgi:hypothetical protein